VTFTAFAPGSAHESAFRFEGLLGEPVSTIENLNQNAKAFLPYNPTIVEVGAFEGAGTVGLARAYPYARIYACEPNPRAFAVLDERVRDLPQVAAVNLAFGSATGEATLYVGSADEDRHASLLPPGLASHGPSQRGGVRVSSTTVDEWCTRQGLERVEFLRLDAGGCELQILQRSRTVLEGTLVVVTKTYGQPPRPGVVSYPILRLFLEMAGFALLSHWYAEGGQGEATFISKVIYDALFG
jgi:FkbM family methyltransferase